MLERLNFWIAYVGSAALVALLAVCLSSPRSYAFACHTSGANGAEQCELVAAQVAVAPEAGELNPEGAAAVLSDPESGSMAATATGQLGGTADRQ